METITYCFCCFFGRIEVILLMIFRWKASSRSTLISYGAMNSMIEDINVGKNWFNHWVELFTASGIQLPSRLSWESHFVRWTTCHLSFFSPVFAALAFCTLLLFFINHPSPQPRRVCTIMRLPAFFIPAARATRTFTITRAYEHGVSRGKTVGEEWKKWSFPKGEKYVTVTEKMATGWIAAPKNPQIKNTL